MMENDILAAAMSAIGTAFGKQAADLTIDQFKSWFDRASQSLEDSPMVDHSHLEELRESVLTSGVSHLETEVTRKNLARWFEIPHEEFTSTPAEQLEPEVLIRHLVLEDMFAKWLKEWGYEVTVGEDLEGREGIDFTPDVYGRMNTLHGEFEVCINFVCDSPPSQYRVRALLETLEAYATEHSEFKAGDIYILATPFEFGRGTAASITLQGREEPYAVVKLEGDDIYELQHARDSHARLEQLAEHCVRAKLVAPRL